MYKCGFRAAPDVALKGNMLKAGDCLNSLYSSHMSGNHSDRIAVNE